ncbi:MAG: dTDP-4-dehydrorhamnose reductase [Gemmatimonadaceae bacterium]
MKVLLLGAGGMLGRDLSATAPREIELIPRTRVELDVTDRPSVARALDEVKPDYVVNASAYTAVDKAEVERERAFAVNADAVAGLAGACAERGIGVAHFSTDYVFDGTGSTRYTEDAPPAPVNAYGESKLAGERALVTSGADALVIRTQWLFGPAGRSFPRTMWERARKRLPTRVVDDQWGRPTYTVDLAGVTWKLVRGAAHGVYHVANAGVATWFDVAALVFAEEGAGSLLTRCSTSDFPTEARRPKFGALDTEKVEALLGCRMPPWEEGVRRFRLSLTRDVA